MMTQTGYGSDNGNGNGEITTSVDSATRTSRKAVEGMGREWIEWHLQSWNAGSKKIVVMEMAA